MSRREHELMACTDKVGFKTFSAANRVVKRQNRPREKRERFKEPREPYRCQFCRLYHIGTKKQRLPEKEFARYAARYKDRMDGDRS